MIASRAYMSGHRILAVTLNFRLVQCKYTFTDWMVNADTFSLLFVHTRTDLLPLCLQSAARVCPQYYAFLASRFNFSCLFNHVHIISTRTVFFFLWLVSSILFLQRALNDTTSNQKNVNEFLNTRLNNSKLILHLIQLKQTRL